VGTYREEVYTPKAALKVAKRLLQEHIDFTFVHDEPEDAVTFSVSWENRYWLKSLAEEHNPPVEIQAVVKHVTPLTMQYVADCLYDRSEVLEPGYYEVPSNAYLGNTLEEAAASLGCYKREIHLQDGFNG
jgi:hypothetical protein